MVLSSSSLFLATTAIFLITTATALEYGDICVPGVGDECDQDQFLKCLTDISNPTCKCDPDESILDPDISTPICAKLAENLGDNCERFANVEPDFCIRKIPNAKCNGTVCVCEDSYFPAQNQCQKYAENLYENCSFPQQCNNIDGAACDHLRVCSCKLETHLPDPTDTSCLAYLHDLFEKCEPASEIDQCSKFQGAGVICNPLTSLCDCNSEADYFLHPGGTRCLKYSDGLGADCETGTEQCGLLDGAECKDSKCHCDLAHATHPDGLTCIVLKEELGEDCEPNADPDHCSKIPGGQCQPLNSTCVCDPTHFQDDRNCQLLPSLPSHKCLIDEHCMAIPNTICPNGQCICRDQFELSIPDLASCVPVPQLLHQWCQNDQSCNKNLQNTRCALNETCSCLDEFVPAEDLLGCLPTVRKIGDDCQQLRQCTWGIDQSFCNLTSNTCECNTGFVDLIVDGGSDRCLQIPPINGSCVETIQCEAIMGPDSICDLNHCGCNEFSQFYNNRCSRSSSLHQNCSLNDECILGVNNYSYCNLGFCKCQVGTVEENDSCFSRPEVGGDCLNNLECTSSINGSVSCVNGKCQCNLSYKPTSDFSTCSNNAEFHRASFISVGIFIIFLIFELK